MIITKMHVSRRTLLKGLGASLALPLLDSMVPALTALQKTAAAPVRRFGVVYTPNGMMMPNWTPAKLRGCTARHVPKRPSWIMSSPAAGSIGRTDITPTAGKIAVVRFLWAATPD